MCASEVLEGFRPKQFTKGVEVQVSSTVPTAIK